MWRSDGKSRQGAAFIFGLLRQWDVMRARAFSPICAALAYSASRAGTR
jgi:hypothetical protein